MLKKMPLKRGTSTLKKTSFTQKPTDPAILAKKLEEGRKMKEFFLYCWDRRMTEEGKVVCYETGVKLSKGYRQYSTVYHHILPKAIYPQFQYEYWNICFLQPAIHMQVETNLDLAPKVKELTKKLKKEHGGKI